MANKYIFKKEEKFIGLDYASGGYPYETDRAFDAKEWTSIEQAMSYKQHFIEKEWSLHEVLGLDLRLIPLTNHKE